MLETHNNKFIQLDKHWFTKKDSFLDKYGHLGLLIYTRIMRTYNFREEVYITADDLFEYLGINKTNSYTRKKIVDVVESFKIGGLFKFDDFSSFVVADVLKNPKPFIGIFDFEINAIMNYPKKIDKGKLFAVFAYLKYHYDYRSSERLIVHPSIKTIQLNTRIKTESSVIEYINVLRDIGLILYINIGTSVSPTGVIKETNNIYTMNYDGHDSLLNEFANKQRQEILSRGYKLLTKTNDVRSKRSDTMKKLWSQKKLK